MGDLLLFPARPKVLRPYQSEALASVLSLLKRGQRPCRRCSSAGCRRPTWLFGTRPTSVRAASFREKFGHWPPPGMNPEPLEPDRVFKNYQKSRRIAYAKAKAKAKDRFGRAQNADA